MHLQVARGLLALGVQQQDRVAVWAPNCVEWLVLQFAVAQVGAVLVNLNPAYRSAGWCAAASTRNWWRGPVAGIAGGGQAVCCCMPAG